MNRKRKRSSCSIQEEEEEKYDEQQHQEVPAWLQVSPLYQMLLDNGGDDDAAATPPGAPVCDLTTVDAALMYRTLAFWLVPYESIPPVFFASWFLVEETTRTQLVDAVGAFRTELHPATCLAHTLDHDEVDKFTAWNAATHRRISRGLVHQVARHGAVRCFQSLMAAQQQTAAASASQVMDWMHSAMRGGHVAMVHHMYHHFVAVRIAFRDGLSHDRLIPPAAFESGSIALVEWLHAHQCEISAHFYHKIIKLWTGRSEVILDWLWRKDGSPQVLSLFTWSTVMDAAAAIGDVDALVWLQARMGQPLHLKNLWQTAATNGHLPVLVWLRDAPAALSQGLVLESRGGYAAAAQRGDMDMLRWLRAQGVAWRNANIASEYIYEAAVQSGPERALQVLEWLRSEQCPYIARPWCNPLSNVLLPQYKKNDGQRKEVLGWLLRYLCPVIPVEWLTRLLCVAMKNGHGVATLELIVSHTATDCGSGYPIDPMHAAVNRDSLIVNALRGGDGDVINWLQVRMGIPCDIFQLSLALGNVNRDTVATLKWLHARGAHIDLWTLRTALTVKGLKRRSKVVAWLRAQSCPWDEGTMPAALALCDRTTVKWLRKRGCAWGDASQVAFKVTRHCNLPMIKWLFAPQQDCPWHPDLVIGAALFSSKAVLEWLVNQHRPMPNRARLLQYRNDIDDHTWSWIRRRLFGEGLCDFLL